MACEKPCKTCTKVADPADCENKRCKLWSQWFLSRWKMIHGFGKELEKRDELEDGSH